MTLDGEAGQVGVAVGVLVDVGVEVFVETGVGVLVLGHGFGKASEPKARIIQLPGRPKASAVPLVSLLERVVMSGGAPLALVIIHDLTSECRVSSAAGNSLGVNPGSAHMSSKPMYTSPVGPGTVMLTGYTWNVLVTLMVASTCPTSVALAGFPCLHRCRCRQATEQSYL